MAVRRPNKVVTTTWVFYSVFLIANKHHYFPKYSPLLNVQGSNTLSNFDRSTDRNGTNALAYIHFEGRPYVLYRYGGAAKCDDVYGARENNFDLQFSELRQPYVSALYSLHGFAACYRSTPGLNSPGWNPSNVQRYFNDSTRVEFHIAYNLGIGDHFSLVTINTGIEQEIKREELNAIFRLGLRLHLVCNNRFLLQQHPQLRVWPVPPPTHTHTPSSHLLQNTAHLLRSGSIPFITQPITQNMTAWYVQCRPIVFEYLIMMYRQRNRQSFLKQP